MEIKIISLNKVMEDNRKYKIDNRNKTFFGRFREKVLPTKEKWIERYYDIILEIDDRQYFNADSLYGSFNRNQIKEISTFIEKNKDLLCNKFLEEWYGIGKRLALSGQGEQDG